MGRLLPRLSLEKRRRRLDRPGPAAAAWETFERRGRTARGVESSGLARSSARRSSDPSPPKPRRRKRRSKAWNVVWGIVFFILGVIGILIPVLPQIPFFLMSLFFFSLVFPPLRRWVRRFLHRHPKLAHAYRKWREKGRRKRQEFIRKEKEIAARLRRHEN